MKKMSTFSFLFNCIILSIGFEEILSMPNSSLEKFEAVEVQNERNCAPNLSKQNYPNQNDQLYGLTHSKSHDTPLRDDYYYTLGIGAHKLHTRARTWNEARRICIEEGGHLAIINSVAEERVLMDIFNRTGPIKGSSLNDEALLGIHDLFAENDWTTVFGDSLAKTGFSTWSDKWNGQPDNWRNIQHCGAILKEGGMDDLACNQPYAFFCELPIPSLLNQVIS
ncbi:hemolymph lipopolysaccharide-binding protein [Megachile rotundata]|uniref:hemolymph lipopolysaccharide-binding protein n=1 Tax=Megachile rotundata TaxID=143995 RepID=UPI000258F7D7|nr:PREDICTED: hemolymph lipopolysaccharide-binding protein-like [Megachile rotundata]